MEYSSSILFYSLILIICLLVSFVAKYTKYDLVQKIALAAIVMILALVAGFRDITVGRDTRVYYYSTYCRIENGNFWNAHGAIGYSVLNLIIEKLFHSYSMVLFTVSVLSYALIISRIWEFRGVISFPFAVFGLITLWYPLSMNVTRQFLAVAIVFWGTRYIQKKKIKFILLVLVATSIHTISLISLVYLPLMMFVDEYRKGISVKKILRYIMTIILICICTYVAFKFLEFDHYITLFRSQMNINWGLGNPLLLFGICFFAFPIHKRETLIEETEILVQQKLHNKLIVLSITGVILAMADYITDNASRVGWFFMIFEIVFFSLKYKSSALNFFAKFYFGGFMIVTYVMEFINNGNRILPYVFRFR